MTRSAPSMIVTLVCSIRGRASALRGGSCWDTKARQDPAGQRDPDRDERKNDKKVVGHICWMRCSSLPMCYRVRIFKYWPEHTGTSTMPWYAPHPGDLPHPVTSG